MLFIERQRLIIRCDSCPVRLDLGPGHVARHVRMPSGWMNMGQDTHMCPLCAAPRLVSLARRAA